MAFAIQSSCINCAACEPECLTAAIFEGARHYVIDPAACNNCNDLFAAPQCVEACPVDAIVLAGADTPSVNVDAQKRLGRKRLQQARDNSTGPQIVSIHQPFGAPDPVVHCPICGQRSIQVIGGSRQASPCPHLAFVFCDEFSEFEYESSDFKKRTADFQKRNLDPGKAIGHDDDVHRLIRIQDFPALLKAAGYDTSLLALEITFGTKSTPYLSATEIYGFDYGSLRKQARRPMDIITSA